jgi:hypothetical protein
METVGVCYVHSEYFMAIWYILWPFGISYGHLVYFMVIWYIFPRFGAPKKSGNPVLSAEFPELLSRGPEDSNLFKRALPWES